MLFNSFVFLFLFLPLVCAIYYVCARRFTPRLAQCVLLASSLAFYGWAKPLYTPLLAASIVFNYLLGKKIRAAAQPWRKRWLVFGLTANIVFLASFKYLGFFATSLSFLWKPGFVLPGWSFPLGISFYTLQQLMYLVDCYEELIDANDLLTHAVFVSFFPYVISGPITRARQMVRQIQEAGATNAQTVSQALALLAIGLFKKVVLADSFSRLADAGFSAPASLSTLEAWLSSFSYTFQIYFDFSGYTDIAIAVALLLGFSLPINFKSPYRSLSITEFWQRWHITLSQFITTYLYTPMVRSLKKITLAKASLITIVAMTIVGLWHGPSWTFVTFGCLHGIALVVNQFWRKKVKIPVPRPLAWAVTFLFLNAAFVFFRAPDLSSALQMCRALLPQHRFADLQTLKQSIRMAEVAVLGLPIAIGVAVAFWGDDSVSFSQEIKPQLRTACGVAFLALISLLYMNSNLAKEFVYFKF